MQVFQTYLPRAISVHVAEHARQIPHILPLDQHGRDKGTNCPLEGGHFCELGNALLDYQFVGCACRGLDPEQPLTLQELLGAGSFCPILGQALAYEVFGERTAD